MRWMRTSPGSGAKSTFQGEPLDNVLAEVSRYTTTRFVIADEKLRDVRVGGYFKIGESRPSSPRCAKTSSSIHGTTRAIA